MSTTLTTNNKSSQQVAVTTQNLFGRKSIQQRFEEMLGDKAQGFISSVLQIVNGNKLLKNADPGTVLNAAATAASLDLPVNPSLGFSWIVPYKGQAQFQMGWKGYVQLALRTGKYKTLNAIPVYKNQYKSFNALTETLDADFSIDGEGEVVGYAAYFSLVNGFEKLSYWPKEKVIKHAKKYSQAYSSKYSPWSDKDQFDAMAMKTVLKNTINKWGIMTIEMEKAIVSDQSVQSQEGQYQYPDNETIDIEAQGEEEEENRVIGFIEKAETKKDLEDLEGFVKDGPIAEAYEAKEKELSTTKK